MGKKYHCPKCNGREITKKHDDSWYPEGYYFCVTCEYSSGYLSEFLYKTKLPIEALEEAISFLEQYYNNLASGGMSDEHGICFIVDRIQSFLEKMKSSLYDNCFSCGRVIAPDEETFIDSVSEEESYKYCSNCSKKERSE